jgi:hypothetical protein
LQFLKNLCYTKYNINIFILQQGTEMILERYAPSKRDTWHWRLAEFSDVVPITMMANEIYGHEVDGIFTQDVRRMAYHVDLAVTRQRYYLTEEQLILAEDPVSKHLLAYAWIARGESTPYASEEMAAAKFAHIDLSLPTVTRVRLMAQILQQWVLWCQICGIPVFRQSGLLCGPGIPRVRWLGSALS